jgi:hypothetical protein
MSELIFCCPNCFAIGSSGAIIDDRSARQLARSSMRVTCEECEKRSSIPMLDFLFSDSFSDGRVFALI